MAQTKRKRRTKHRGTAAGTIQTRGRTGRPPTAEERKKQSRHDRARAAREHAADVEVVAHAGGVRGRDHVHLPGPRRPRASNGSSRRSSSPCSRCALYVPAGYYMELFLYRRRQRKKDQRDDDRRPHVHRRAGAGELLHRAREGLRPRPDRRPRRRGRRCSSAVEALGITTVDAILVTHTHFDHVGAVAPVAQATTRAGLLPRARAPGARQHHGLRPVARLRPVRELRRRPHRQGRRDARARRPDDRRDLHARPQPRPRHLRDPRRARRCSPATSCSRARSAASIFPAATGRRCCARSRR